MAILDTLITRLGFKVDTKGLKDAEKRVDAFKTKMKSAGDSAVQTGTLLTGALIGLGKVVLDFEKRMNGVQAALGDKGTAGAMKELRDQAKLMGATTAFSAVQAAEAQEELAKAGFSVQQITSALPGTLSLAAAGTLSMGEAAAITTSILAGYGFEVDQSARVSDVLAAAAASAKTDVSAMGFAFSKAAPAAKALGVEFETTAAMLAALQDAGLSAEIAGTGLKTVLFTLAKPSKEAEKAIQGMGISLAHFRDLVKQGKINEVFKLLAENGLDAAASATIFGKEMGGQALILAEATSKVDNLSSAYKQADGAAKQMAETKMQGLPGAFALLISKAEGAILALGDAGLTDVLIGLADGIGFVVGKFSEAPPFIQKMVIAALALGPALLAVGFAMKAIAGAIAFVQAIKAATGAMAIFNAVATANPIGIIIVAIGALIAALSALVIYWDDVVNAISSGWDWVKGAAGAVAGFFGFGDDEGGAMAGAPAAASAPGANVANVQNTANYNVRNMNVDARGGDSKEIAQNVNGAIRDQFQNTANDFDSAIAY